MSIESTSDDSHRPKGHRTNQERRQATRLALVQAARQLFMDKGFAATGTPEIVRTAKVTRGALYHHFSDKAQLLHAVVLAEAQAVADQIAQRTQTPASPLQALVLGASAYFDAMGAPGRARLLLREGPAILGPEVMAYIDAQTGGAELRDGLAMALQATDANSSIPLTELAEILSAGFDRAAWAIASGRQPEPYLQALTALLTALVETQQPSQ